jgi:outer membrane protein OmpA-like peptidoglycan-associated protein/tetratricopeptide (TPR) repeat protein
MRNFFFTTLLFLTVSSNLSSQSTQKFEKYYKKSLVYFNEKDYLNAEAYLNKAIKENSSYSDAYAILGDLYFKKKEYSKALDNYFKADSINSENYLKFKMAESYFMLGKYKKAKILYQAYLGHTPSYYKGAKTAHSRIKNCDFAMDAMDNSIDFNPSNLGKGINTAGYEYNPVVSTDGRSLIFTTVKDKHGRKVEDFYISEFRNGKWQQAEPLPGSVNTSENEGAHCISIDNKFLFFTACGRQEGFGSCDIYVSIKVDGKWSKSVNLGRNVNSSSWDAHPALSPDGTTLIYSSTRPGGKGKKDLWSIKFKNGSWGIPKNLSELNTKGNEVTPYFHADGKTLYFSSDGLPGMGGTDFFVSYFDEVTNHWGEPINLGYGINSPRDEYSLMVARDGKTAYFASDALKGYGNMDIYTFQLNKRVRSANTAYLKGRIVEMSNKKNIPNSTLVIVDLKSSKQIKSVFVEKGNYKAVLPVGGTYAIVASSPKHLLYSETFDFMKDTVANFLEKDFKLRRLRRGQKMNLNNVNFKFNESILLGESYFELDLLVAFLKVNSKYKVKIIGHTDNVGTKENNKKLSVARAEVVEKYLIRKGINKARLKSIGKGASQPISTNSTEEGRKKNRRTEIVLF